MTMIHSVSVEDMRSFVPIAGWLIPVIVVSSGCFFWMLWRDYKRHQYAQFFLEKLNEKKLQYRPVDIIEHSAKENNIVISQLRWFNGIHYRKKYFANQVLLFRADTMRIELVERDGVWCPYNLML